MSRDNRALRIKLAFIAERLYGTIETSPFFRICLASDVWLPSRRQQEHRRCFDVSGMTNTSRFFHASVIFSFAVIRDRAPSSIETTDARTYCLFDMGWVPPLADAALYRREGTPLSATSWPVISGEDSDGFPRSIVRFVRCWLQLGDLCHGKPSIETVNREKSRIQ